MDSSKYAQRLIAIATKSHRDANGALDGFLDYILDTFEVDNLFKHNFDYGKIFIEAKERNEDYFHLMTDWFEEVAKEEEKGLCIDFFGKMYEETWKGKGKASALGQFFTPESICRMMARITAVKTDGTFSDCACGSGRTLLAAFEQADKSKFCYFDAGDIDYISCKMCALNFMVHGMIGEVRQQDALLMTTPYVIYKVNEIRYPHPTNLFSIRRVYPSEEQKEEIPPKAETQGRPSEPVQLSLF